MKRLWHRNIEAPRTVPRRNHREPVPKGSLRRYTRYLRVFRRFPWALPGVAVLVGIGIGVHHFVYSSPFFEIESIEVSGAKRIAADKVLAAIEEHAWVMPGSSLFTVTLEEVESAAERLSIVASAHAERVWPNKLTVTIEERIPVGILVTEAGSHVFDADGFLFSESLPSDYTSRNLSILTGAPVVVSPNGGRVQPSAFDHFRQYDTVFRRANRELVGKISEFHWDDDRGMTLLMKNGSRYSCGFRAPGDVGPMVEMIAAHHDAPGRPIVASLFSDHSVAIRDRVIQPATTTTRQIARQR